MSQAEALLRSLNSGAVAEYSNNAVTEPFLVIGDDRTIRVPDDLKRLAVQYDHNIETVTFDCPRFWDNHDLSTMKVYVNYRTADATLGSYPVKSVTVNGDRMQFDWEISGNVTKARGNIAFLVSVSKTDGEGVVANYWNSELCTECYISQGMKAGETVLIENSDVITFLLTRMDEVNAIATPEAMQEYTNTWLEANKDFAVMEIELAARTALATIPTDYTKTYNAAQEAIRTKADAVYSEVSGEGPLLVTNSSNDHIKGIKMLGKTAQVTTTGANLWDPTEATHPSTGTLRYSMDVEPNTTYTLGVSRGSVNGLYASVNSDMSDSFAAEYGKNSLTFTTGDVSVIYLQVYSATQDFTDSDVIYFNEGNGIIYEPYSGGAESPRPVWSQKLSEVSSDIHIYGKNLARLGTAINTTVSGLDIVGDADSSHVTVNGTATNANSHVLMRSGTLPPGKYTISVYGLNRHDSSNDRLYAVQKVGNALLVNYIQPGFPKTVELTEYSEIKIDAVFAAGSTYNNQVISVQIEVGETATEYEPYTKSQVYNSDFELLGIPVSSGGNYTDSNGQQWVCDEVDFERRVYIQRIKKVVFDGTEAWQSQTIDLDNCIGMHLMDVPWGAPKGQFTLVCSHFIAGLSGTSGRTLNRCAYNNLLTNFLINADSNMCGNTVTKFKTWLSTEYASGNPVTLHIALAEPVEIPITDTNLYSCLDLKTNYHNTTVFRGKDAYLEMKYIADTTIYIDEMSDAIADERIQAAVDNWLEAHFTSAEGVSF